MNMMKNNKGQALVEYVLIIALISIVLIGVINTFGGVLKDKITEASCAISNQQYNLSLIHISEPTRPY